LGLLFVGGFTTTACPKVGVVGEEYGDPAMVHDDNTIGRLGAGQTGFNLFASRTTEESAGRCQFFVSA
jgi:hypothetical protein